jgi:general secretion pathway protein B
MTATTHPDAFAAAREARRNAFARETAAARAANSAAAVPAPVHPAAQSTAAAHPGAVAVQSPTPATPAAQTRSHSDAAAASAPAQHASAPTPTATPPAVAVVPPGAVKPEPPAAPTASTEHLPMYYEMPYDVRKDLPPLVVSMHVFGKDPAQRFVVVDGERKVEGEAIKDGLTLREIHNDGMVLEFRGQRFFYPRPGR